MIKLFWKLTGGRPMRQMGHRFIDRVSGKSVYAWEDKLGRTYLAEGPWSWFRVGINTTVDD